MTLDDMVETTEQVNRPHGLMVQYTSGGHHGGGCAWEWCLGLFDHKGRWHSIYSSGRHGLGPQDGDAAVRRFGLGDTIYRDATMPLEDEQLQDADGFSNKCFVFRYLDPEALAKALAQVNPGFALSIGKWLVDRSTYGDHIAEHNIRVELPCCRCHESFPVGDLEVDPHNYHGDGGIGVVYEGLVCNDCAAEELYDEDNEETEDEADSPLTPQDETQA